MNNPRSSLCVQLFFEISLASICWKYFKLKPLKMIKHLLQEIHISEWPKYNLYFHIDKVIRTLQFLSEICIAIVDFVLHCTAIIDTKIDIVCSFVFGGKNIFRVDCNKWMYQTIFFFELGLFLLFLVQLLYENMLLLESIIRIEINCKDVKDFDFSDAKLSICT